MSQPVPIPPVRPLLASAVVGLAGVGLLALPAAATTGTGVPKPDNFTSAFVVEATPQEVVAMDGSVGVDNAFARGTFNLKLNSDMDVICYSIRLQGVTPPYMSPARTSTHIHEAAAGQSGPPRIVFPDPLSSTDTGLRTSTGCLQGPFTTGVTGNGGSDTGAGFTVAELEASPSDYYVDVHTTQFAGGAVRGQLLAASPAAGQSAAGPQADPPAAAAPPSSAGTPVGGVAAGFGGLSSSPAALPTTAALAAALLVIATGATGWQLLSRRGRPAVVREGRHSA
jgi:hypothetical protein